MSALPVGRRLYRAASPRQWLRVARSLLAFYRDKPSPVPPMAVAWDLSYRCDCRCAFCNTHDLARMVRTLPRESALVIARKLARARVPLVTLSGGEPLLVPYWHEVADMLARAGARVAVSTNGSRLGAEAERIVAAGVQVVTISVDDVSGERHDEVRQRAGLSAAIDDGLARLRRADVARRVAVRIRMVVTPTNYRQMAELVATWKPRVDEVSFQPVEDSGSDHIHHVSENFAGFEPEDEQPFRAALARLFACFPEFDTPYYRRMPAFLFAHEQSRQSFQCLLPAFGVKIRPDGQAITCAGGGATLGSLVTQPLAEVWNAAPMCALRSESLAGRRSCYCWVQPTSINYRAPETVRRALMSATAG